MTREPVAPGEYDRTVVCSESRLYHRASERRSIILCNALGPSSSLHSVISPQGDDYFLRDRRRIRFGPAQSCCETCEAFFASRELRDCLVVAVAKKDHFCRDRRLLTVCSVQRSHRRISVFFQPWRRAMASAPTRGSSCAWLPTRQRQSRSPRTRRSYHSQPLQGCTP